MAAPAVGCTDKDDSPGVAHFRPLSLLCGYPDSPPKPFLPLPVFECTRNAWVREAFIPWGSGKGGLCRKPASCVPVAFGGDIPTLDRQLLCPARVVRAPGCEGDGHLPGSLRPKTHLGVAFEFQVVVLCPDLEIPVAQPPAPRHCHPVKFPPQGIRACSSTQQAQLEDPLPWAFPVTAHEAQPSETLSMAVLYFVI